jgi:energy-converting hydrogenase Eha subunit B
LTNFGAYALNAIDTNISIAIISVIIGNRMLAKIVYSNTKGKTKIAIKLAKSPCPLNAEKMFGVFMANVDW